MVTEPSVYTYCVHIEISVSSFLFPFSFFKQELDRCVSLDCVAAPDNTSASRLRVTGVSHACVEISLGKDPWVPFPFLGLWYTWQNGLPF